jgi:ketosteroid isomerase-like protein
MTPTEIALRYLELSNTGETEAAEALEHPDIRFWLSGRLVVSGDLSPAQHRKAAAGVHDTFPGGYRLDIKSVTEQDGRVAIEAKGDGVLADGARYTPDYAFFFEIRDRLIASLHEYIDTEYVGATFKLQVKA